MHRTSMQSLLQQRANATPFTEQWKSPAWRDRGTRRNQVARAHADDRGTSAGVSRRASVQQAIAATASLFLTPSIATASSGDPRQELLQAIKAKKGDDGVIKALRELQEKNPTRSPAKSDLLYGKWKLLWASDNSEVSIATRRLPIAASSVQLVGEKGGVEKGRAANLIQLFGGAVTVKLSSAAVPDPKSDDTILIGPPFYLELKLGSLSIPIQNTQKEGERKSLLGAEQNYYVQLYLEDKGQPGDLRISEVRFGDPAAKGSIFVHERI